MSGMRSPVTDIHHYNLQKTELEILASRIEAAKENRSSILLAVETMKKGRGPFDLRDPAYQLILAHLSEKVQTSVPSFNLDRSLTGNLIINAPYALYETGNDGRWETRDPPISIDPDVLHTLTSYSFGDQCPAESRPPRLLHVKIGLESILHFLNEHLGEQDPNISRSYIKASMRLRRQSAVDAESSFSRTRAYAEE